MAASKERVHIIGAGPAGMACAYTLARGGHAAIVIDGDISFFNTFWSQGPQQEYLEM
ncbi:MAG TPA: FAD-binding protein [Candidatus Heimdallarchaeota archaeon]|nr:FAD-binding protein [Candidatus Heimdallarchaeota archaeon]